MAHRVTQIPQGAARQRLVAGMIPAIDAKVLERLFFEAGIAGSHRRLSGAAAGVTGLDLLYQVI